MQKMTPSELSAVSALSAIMSLRLIGLFMVLPVFAPYANNLMFATPTMVGLAMGIYGLTQCLLQIPFGMLSDRIGRKPVIAAGLIIFIIGSIIAAFAHSIYFMILGRALQGAGAVGSAIIAALADFTRVEQRTKAMAINGIMIGFSFMLAMVLGPALASVFHIQGIFWLAAGFSMTGIILLFTLIPAAPKAVWHADTEAAPNQFLTLLKDPLLARLYIGVFLLHAMFTASFCAIPEALQNHLSLPENKQWQIYVPALALAFIATLLLIMVSEKKRLVKRFFMLAIVLLGLSESILLLGMDSKQLSLLGLCGFFTGFSVLEAFLPSYVSRAAPRARKGTALGIYSCAQFLGIFVGGMLGGFSFSVFGIADVYLFCAALALLWLAIAFHMKDPQYSTTTAT
ncbi:MAG: MFS transporter [Pseudomonadota bacterium]